MSKVFSSEEQLLRWENRREIKNIMVRMISQDYMFRRENQAYERYWSKAQDVCLGVNGGYYKGAVAVQRYFKGIEEQTKLESTLIQKKFPVRLGDKSEEEIYGVGILRYKAMEIPVVEIAGDGMTAKAIYHIHGCNTKLTSGGQVSYWERGWVACDMVWEDESWRVWHMLYVQDIDHPTGTKWTDQPPVYEEDPLFAPIKNFQFPEPNVKLNVRETYHAMRKHTPPPEYPEPYETFSETFSYGI